MTVAAASAGALDKVVARVRQLLPDDAVISDHARLRTYECDGLAHYRVTPALVVIPEDTAQLAAWAHGAGWTDVATDADPTTGISLADEDAFRAWLRVGRMSTDWPAERIDAFASDLMAASPRGADGSFRLPFGSQYLTARRPS